jgi:biotin synthase
MGWKLDTRVEEILRKGREGEGITHGEAVELLRLDIDSRESYALLQAANALSRQTFGDKGENHVHLGINVEQCPYDCAFCSLTRTTGIFTEKIEFDEETILGWARNAAANNADGLNIMTTGTYKFERLLETGRMLTKAVDTPLIANTRDISHREGEMLLEAGFSGAYHAIRLREGVDTPFKIDRRIKTLQVLKDVGLLWMNCVEPVGPEHTPEELADLMLLARRYGAAYSGVMRRINFPGSPLADRGMITEREMARMIAVSRLVMGLVPKAHCTHEPNTAALWAGANLFFPEAGASPRDTEADAGKGRGRDIAACRAIQWEMGLDPDLPSNCYEKHRN